MVQVESVRRDVRPDRVRDAQGRLVGEQVCILRRAPSDVEAEQQFRVPVDGGEIVGVALAFQVAIEERGLFLLADERKQLTALNVGRLDVLHRVRQELKALLPGLDDQPQNRVLVQAGHPGRGPNAHALQEQVEGEGRLVDRSLLCRQGLRFAVRLAAFQAAIPPLAVAGLTELRGRLSAVWAVHPIRLFLAANRVRTQLSRPAFRQFAWVAVAPRRCKHLRGFLASVIVATLTCGIKWASLGFSVDF